MLPRAHADQCEGLRLVLEDAGPAALAAPIVLDNIPGPSLDLVRRFLAERPAVGAARPLAAWEVEEWDATFCAAIETDVAIDLLKAMSLLECAALRTALHIHFAAMIKGKTAEEIRAAFGIADDQTAEEHAAIEAENAWGDEE